MYFLAVRNLFRFDESDPVFNRELAWGILRNLGFVEQQLGNLEAAKQLYLQPLKFFRELGGRGNMTTLFVRLAAVEEQLGNCTTALAYASEALDWSQRLGMIQEQMQAEVISARLK